MINHFRFLLRQSLYIFLVPSFLVAVWSGLQAPDAQAAPPQTWYVRTDGGTATQCTGLADAAYSGTGTNQACAFKNPMYALGWNGGQAQKMAGGDTLIIGDPGSNPGQFKIGYDENSPQSGCYALGAYDCYMLTVPAGPTPSTKTKIYGRGYASGTGIKPQLWGTERVTAVLTLSSNVDVQFLDITDHSNCIENGPLDGSVGGDPVQCKRNSAPFGNWAPTGISAYGAANVHLENLDIHGLASRGIFGMHNGDWVLNNVNVIANGFVGWDSDIPTETDDSYSGTTTLINSRIAWSGCGEKYPITTTLWRTSTDKHHCWSQSQGGYGDGIGLGDGEPGNWTVIGSDISFNTSDGFDMLHGSGGSSIVKFIRSVAEGNAGQQFKGGGLQNTIESSVIVGNCGFHYQKPFTSTRDSGGNSVPFDTCRANGDVLAFPILNSNQQFRITNSTVIGNGDSLIYSGGTGCTSATVLSAYNSIFLGGRQFNDDSGLYSGRGNDITGLYYSGGSNGNGAGSCGILRLTGDYNIFYGLKSGKDGGSADTSVVSGPNNKPNTNPQFAGTIQQGPAATTGYYANTDYFQQLALTGASPAINAANSTVALVDTSNDILNFSRGSSWDIGAYEYSGTSTPIPTPTPTPTPIPKPGDIDRDNDIDIFDYNRLVGRFGQTGSAGWIPEDIDSNGRIDIFDYNLLVGNFGK